MGASEAITITGTRRIAHRPPEDYDALFAGFLRPFAHETAHFYIGGATGIDSLALRWLAAETNSRISVVVPGTATGQPADAREAIMAARKRGRLAELVELRRVEHPSAEAYHFRNRWMVDRSRFVIAFPRDEDRTSGTWYTVNYAAEHDRPRLIVPV